MRSGKRKLHLAGQTKAKGKGAGLPALYDLEADIGEQTNVLASNPQVAARLCSYAKAFEEELAKNSRPAACVENPRPLSIEKSK